MRGAGWGRKHATVDYVFTYEPERLVAYHALIMEEMKNRGYNPDPIWKNPNWRGKVLQEQADWCDMMKCIWYFEDAMNSEMIYPEHNDTYLKECLDNLKQKGIEIEL